MHLVFSGVYIDKQAIEEERKEEIKQHMTLIASCRPHKLNR